MPVSEARRNANEKFKWVMSKGLTPLLRSHGFKSKHLVFWRDIDNAVTHAIAARRSRWSESGEVNFDFHCGVSVHAWRDLFPDWKWIPTPAKPSTQIYIRPRQISGYELDHDWWKIWDADSDQAVESVAYEVRLVFERHVLPWLVQFQTAKDVGDYISAPEKGAGRTRRYYRDIPQDAYDLRQAAIAYFGAGDYTRARECVDLAMATIDRHGKGHTADLRERMERLIAMRKSGQASPEA